MLSFTTLDCQSVAKMTTQLRDSNYTLYCHIVPRPWPSSQALVTGLANEPILGFCVSIIPSICYRTAQLPSFFELLLTMR